MEELEGRLGSAVTNSMASLDPSDENIRSIVFAWRKPVRVPKFIPPISYRRAARTPS